VRTVSETAAILVKELSDHGNFECWCSECMLSDGHSTDRARAKIQASLETYVNDLVVDYDRLERKCNLLEAALEKILNGRFHIGNDENGNMFGPPDSVMCRNIARAALEGKR